MNLRLLRTRFIVLGAIGTVAAVPMNAPAQTVTHWIERQTKTSDKDHGHHDSGKSWQSLSYVGAGAAVLGILAHSPALFGIGVLGGLYSTYRFEQDRKSIHAADHRRYAYFSKKTRWIDGHRYHRVTVHDHGHDYYAYKRG
jgi:hypothetical protein